jgi:hypothetical protein
MRARLLVEIAVRSWRAARARNSDRAPSGLRGNASAQIWDVHYRNFRRRGWSYLRADRFTHHCTDGPECPCAYVFSRRDVGQLFRAFTAIRTRVAHLPLNKYPLANRVPRWAERRLGAALGWHLQIRAVK